MRRLIRYLTWNYDATYYCSLDGSFWRPIERSLRPFEDFLRRMVCHRKGHRFGNPLWTWKTYCSRCGKEHPDAH